MQIQEFLNRDKNIASIVSDAVRRGVSRFEQVVDPARREQLNMLEIQNVGEYINQIKIKLTDKLNIFSTILPATSMNTADVASNIDKITNYLSDMIDYNKVIQVYINPANTPQTKSEIFNKLEPLKALYQKLDTDAVKLLDKILDINDPLVFKKFFVKVLRILALYKIIHKQFVDRNFRPITDADIMLMIDDIVRKELYYGKVIKDHKLDLKPPPAAPPPAPPIAPSATPMGAPPPLFPSASSSSSASSRPFLTPSSSSGMPPTPSAASMGATSSGMPPTPSSASRGTTSSSSSSDRPDSGTPSAALAPEYTPRTPFGRSAAPAAYPGLDPDAPAYLRPPAPGTQQYIPRTPHGRSAAPATYPGLDPDAPAYLRPPASSRSSSASQPSSSVPSTPTSRSAVVSPSGSSDGFSRPTPSAPPMPKPSAPQPLPLGELRGRRQIGRASCRERV